LALRSDDCCACAVRIHFYFNMSYGLRCFRPVIASQFSALDQISWIASAYFLTRTSRHIEFAHVPHCSHQKPPFYSCTAHCSPSSIENTSSKHSLSACRIALSSHVLPHLCSIGSVFWFEVGSLFCAVAPNVKFLIFGRAVSGMGGAGSTCYCPKILTAVDLNGNSLRQCFVHHRRDHAFGGSTKVIRVRIASYVQVGIDSDVNVMA
jgi:hypothetical protein